MVEHLKDSKGYSHLLTCVDGFTQWSEAVLIKDITAKTVACASAERWLANSGRPSTTTKDRVRQYESENARCFITLLEITYSEP